MSVPGEPGQYPFPLDPFQRQAIEALDAGRHVVVAAPTGSGKTVVAEHAIAAAVRRGERAAYTAPLKALSNQKFNDLTALHGPARVGLLTGDRVVNPGADILVMTTEVLRNMIYADAPDLGRLGAVVLDEVHFLQDTYRGPVWEEVIVHLPDHVRLVCLSATVSNAQELADWITTVRGPTTAIVELRRPVRLHDAYLIGDRTNDRLHLFETFVSGRANPDATRLDNSAVRRGGGRGRHTATRGAGRRVLYTPGRVEVVELLAQRALLPAIVFIFSRNQCDEAARTCVDAGLRLTTPEERERIREIVEARLGGIDDHDLDALGYGAFVAQLEAGVAAHHAGLIPAFKETVEACFIQGLIDVVFATETLAVGVNMPARTVVIEKLTKFTGDHHEMLTPGEYTQLTGRAGRRGIDDEGHAVVLWSPFVPFDQVAQLASSRSFHLRSAFRPTYNMAANLVARFTSDEAHHLLNLSYAQYQADRDVVRLETRAHRLREQIDTARAEAESPYGDIWEYRRQEDDARRQRAGVGDRVETALRGLRPGDVVSVASGRARGSVVVVANAQRRAGTRLTAVTRQGDLVLVTGDDFARPPTPIGHVALPAAYAPHRAEFRKEVARALARHGRSRGRRSKAAELDEAPGIVHPVELDPDLRQRTRAAGQAERYQRELAELAVRVDGHQESLARDFDRVLGILVERDYIDPGDVDTPWSLTERGWVLARVFHESDLLVAECLLTGLLDDVDAPTMAGLLSVFVYEHRSPEPPSPPWFPNNDARQRWRRIVATSEDLAADEQVAGWSIHRPPDPGFAAAAYAWVAGEELADVVADEELTGGDFVRTMKQLVDLARQVADVAPRAEAREQAARVARTAFRGVVADVPVPLPPPGEATA